MRYGDVPADYPSRVDPEIQHPATVCKEHLPDVRSDTRLFPRDGVRVQVPHDDRAVARAADHEALARRALVHALHLLIQNVPVAVELEAQDGAAVARESRETLARLQAPHLDRSVARASDDA